MMMMMMMMMATCTLSCFCTYGTLCPAKMAHYAHCHIFS